jgi:hypothetical protein
MWPGIAQSSLLRISWWPDAALNVLPSPTDPNKYNVYRGTGANLPFSACAPLAGSQGVVPRSTGGGNGTTTAILYYFVTDKTVVPSTSYTYYVTTVSATGVESVPGPALTMTTAAGSATVPTLPAPFPDPSTWMPTTPTTITAAPGGTTWTPTTGAALQTALTSMNPAGGDVIILQAGTVYAAPSNGFQPRDMTGATQWTYIVSSEAPEVGGTKLPAYVPYSDPYYPEGWTLTAPASIGATSATLTKTWTRKTGIYPVQFFNTAPNTEIHEQRYCLFTQGSASITWNSSRNPCGWDGTVGPALITNCSATISVKFLPGITLYDHDNGATAILQGGGPGSAGYVIQQLAGTHCAMMRFIGLELQIKPDATYFQNFYCALTGGPNIFWDRCIVGDDTSLFSTSGLPNCTPTANYGFVHHGLQINGANQVVHQCYIQGIMQTPKSLGQDSNGFVSTSGGPYCIEYTYIEAVSEGFIFGGGFVPQATHPQQLTYRGCFNTKLQWWPVSRQTFVFGGGGGPTINASFTGNGTAGPYGPFPQSTSWDRSNRFYITVAGVVQAPSTYTISHPTTTTGQITFSAPVASGAAISVVGQALYIFGDHVKNHAEIKVMKGGNLYGNTHWNSWESAGGGGNYRGASFSPGTRDQPASNPNTNFNVFKTCPWDVITDLDIHDNVSWRVQCDVYPFGCVDYNPIVWAGRYHLHNNQAWLCGNPVANLENIYRHQMFVVPPNGILVDFTIENNTWVFDPFGCSNQPNAQRCFDFIGFGGATPSAGLFDRFLIRNNIVPEPIAVGGDPNGTFNLNNANLTNPSGAGFERNLMIQDNTGPFGSLPNYHQAGGIPYNTIGLKNFVNNQTPPVTPSDWNNVGSTYLGTDGRPVGATIGSTLAGDAFPRTFWQVIAPGGGSGVTYAYANTTFRQNAAKFNIVNPGAFMGIEQTMGNTTFETIFADIKTQAAANGIFPCRCIIYVNSWAQSLTGAGGNGGTYTIWSSALDNANWWLRTSYPAGAIVHSTFGGETTNTGVLAQTIDNTVLNSSGRTFWQGFWDHYDGVLRLGNAVQQGYASNLAFALNPNLDGYQLDNIFCQPRVAGAWAMNTTSYAAADPTAAAFIQQGQQQLILSLKAVNPDLLLMCNADYFVHSTNVFSSQVTLDPTQQGLMDIVYCQAAIGIGGIEGQGGTTFAQFMANLAAAEAQMAPTGTLIFEQTGPSHGVAFSSANQASWTTTLGGDWQNVRYGQAAAFMRNRHYALNFSQNYSPTAPYFTDEILQQNGKFGWLGQPVDPPQTAARTNGVWWRQFRGGVVFCNPAANGIQTINLASLGLTGLSAIASNGFGDASVNNGAPVTSITLQARDGRFLKF